MAEARGFSQEVEAGERFQFGANWARFLAVVDEGRVAEAEASLKEMLGVESLEGQRFLDIGCGSGLFSLAACRLGATVRSFDFDPQSVNCTRELKSRFRPNEASWLIEEGSVLNRAYVESLGEFDVVYSWGVLHHTGAMWLALDHAIRRVAPNGRLLIAIYNDQGWKSHVWWLVKAFYNRLPSIFRGPFVGAVAAVTRLLVILKYTILLRPMTAIAPLLSEARERGMSAKYDRADWIGGFPYEVATFETLRAYVEARDFSLINTKRTTSWGCNELAFQRTACAA